MNSTVLHIFKKDVYRTRYAFVGLVTVLLAKALLLGAAIRLVQSANGATILDPINAMGSYNLKVIFPVLNQEMAMVGFGCFTISDYPLILMLILWVLSEDKPEDERSFWRSRPISGRQMFQAKALYIFLVSWGLQALAQVLVTLIAGETLGNLKESLVWMTAYQALFVPPIIIAGVLWRNALLGFCVELLMFFAYVVFFNWFSMRRGFVDMSQLSLALMVLSAVFIAGWMYIRRGRVKGFCLLALGYSMIFAVTWIASLFR